MPQAKIHPHPEFDIQCKRCRFWHPNYRTEMLILPSGQAIPKAQAISGGMLNANGALTQVMSNCFFNPQWVMTGEDQYCSHWEAESD